ncbi:MAG TPA: nuclear transport factor 2 family protein [Pyrinomonadaceae bacterium]
MNEEEEVRALMRRWDDALVNRNFEFIDSILAEDFTYIAASGQVQNKAELLASIRSPELRIAASSSSNVVVRLYGDVAVAIAEGRIKGSYKSQEFENRYRFTDVWVRRHGKWVAANTQITALPRQTAP